ncbi:MAG: PAS domain S-box protein [Paludisphaera borealis]|uniref:PAS domain S-box protein n=1 Tax=Paludisphaera borealis TaxID=1387353 RepID=UPI0028480F06|nr:PAS domain S-box protein [Paludisphaera borealis]MDR3620676.1 PAS domain S-box protein [Paludisphaera borealis]
MDDFARFSLSDMAEYGVALRKLGRGAASMEEVAGRIVRFFYDHLVDEQSGERSCVLIRFFKTHPFNMLDADLQRFAQNLLGRPPESPAMKCLVLMATAGVDPAWNSRRTSTSHQAIPLPSEQVVRDAPMIVQLIEQFGLEVSKVLQPDPALLLDLEQRTYNVFLVPEARGSPNVPAQAEFVISFGVRSVLGFGGMLPSGDLFAVILFSKVSLSREIADLFQPLALCVKSAVLSCVGGTVFAPPSALSEDGGTVRSADEDVGRLRSRVAALEQLLEVHEQAIVDQAHRIQRASENLDQHAMQLACSAQTLSEQSRILKSVLDSMGDGVIVVDQQAKIMVFNPAAERLLGHAAEDMPLAEWSPQYGCYRPDMTTPFPSEELPLARAMRGESIDHGEVFIKHAGDVQGRLLSVIGRPLKDESGQMRGGVVVFHDITERKRAEQRLAMQHALTRGLAESDTLEEAASKVLAVICETLGWSVGALWWVDVEQGVLRCSNLWRSPSSQVDEFAALSRRITFAPGAGLPGRVWASGQTAWIPDVTQDANFPRAPVAVREGLHAAFGFPIVIGNYVLGVVEAFSGEILQPDDALLQMLAAVGSQIGQFMKRKHAEEEVLQERFLLRSLMDTVPDSIYFKDAEGRFIRINNSLAARFGLSDPAEAVGKSDFDFLDEKHSRQAWEDDQAVMKSEQPVVGKEVKETWGHGRAAWVSTTKMPLRDKHGQVIGTFGVSRDITALKRAEEALRQGEERFRSLVEATVAIVWNTPASGEFETEQPGWSAFTGQTFDQLKGCGWLDAVHPDDRPNTARVWSAAVSARSLYQIEHRLRRYDGEYRHMLVRAVPILEKGDGVREWFGVHTDIDAERRAEAAMREAEERARLLLESSGEGIYGIDVDGRCSFINRAAAALLGYQAEDVRGQNMHMLIHHTRPDGSPYPLEDCPIYRTFRVGRGCRVDHEVLWRRDGTAFPVEYASYPLRGGDGEIEGAVVNFTDITERKQVERELVRAKEAAQAATQAKSEFLANMSHEIRTPLNGIIGMTDLMLDTELTPDQQEYLGMVKLSADQLQAVISDILDFSKIEAGKLDLDLIEFHLRDALDDTVATLATRAHKKGLELADHVAADVPEALTGDPHRLCQVIVNLIGNAIKFTERGEVVLAVEAQSRTEREVLLHFAIRDTGIGISPDQQQKVFKAFTQADTSTTRKYGGTGLGLAISAHIVQLMGGELWLESQPGRGSTFHFTIRFGLAAGPVVRPTPAEPAQVHGLSVLVVDDNATNRRILQEMLSNWGMKPTVVEGGRQAIAALEQASGAGTPFALVLLDAMMPEMDGFELVERIKQNSELVGAALMMLSSTNLREDAARCRKLGVAAYLTKPVRQSTLLDVIMTSLGPAVRTLEQAGPSTAHMAPGGSRRKLRLLLAEDNPVNQRLAVSLLKKRGHSVVVAGNGREALAAVDAQRFDAVLMDVQMPEMDGFETTAAIRAREAGTGVRIPIVAMTAHAMKGDRDRCLAAGMDAYVSKPIQSHELFEVLEGLSPVPPNAGGPAAEPTAQPVAFDMSAALERLDGDAELMSELAGLFLEECPKRMAEIREAIIRRDAVRLQHAAHTLKGSVGNFGAGEAFEATVRLELIGSEQNWDHAERAWAALDEAVGRLNSALAGLGQTETS